MKRVGFFEPCRIVMPGKVAVDPEVRALRRVDDMVAKGKAEHADQVIIAAIIHLIQGFREVELHVSSFQNRGKGFRPHPHFLRQKFT